MMQQEKQPIATGIAVRSWEGGRPEELPASHPHASGTEKTTAPTLRTLAAGTSSPTASAHTRNSDGAPSPRAMFLRPMLCPSPSQRPSPEISLHLDLSDISALCAAQSYLTVSFL